MKELIKKVLRETHKGTYHREGDVEEWRINPYEHHTKDYRDLIKAIDKLPDTIDEITMPREIQMFNPAKIVFNPDRQKDWKERVKKIIVALARRGDILSYSLSSYFGTGNKNYDKHPYYISLELPGSKEFAERMRSGEYGSLD